MSYSLRSRMAAVCIAALTATAAQAVAVSTELVLMMDTSGSISNTDFAIQRDGYRDAFLDATVQSYITNSPGGVAVTLVQWSSGQQQTIGWTLLQTAADAANFSASINGMGRFQSGSTGTTDALNFSANLLSTNIYDGVRSVIDVSSDGFDNTASGCADFNATCTPLQTARNAYLANASHSINALWIADPGNYTQAQLLGYGTANLVGGTNSFQTAVTGSSTFDVAIRDKLAREIGQVPEPASLSLAGLALLGLAAVRRRNT